MKLISILGASALAFGLCGAAYAQNEQNPNTQNQQTPQTQQQGTPSQDGGAGDAAKRDRDYQAEVKKCDGASDKQKCLDAAKKKFNQM